MPRSIATRLFLSYLAIVLVGLTVGAVASAGGQGLIVVARPRAVFADTIRALLPSLVISALVSAGFALVLAALLSRTITRPLRELVSGARRFAGGEHETRVPVAGPSE